MAEKVVFSTLRHDKMNTVFENLTSFYLLNRISTDKWKKINRAEKETFIVFRTPIPKSQTNKARNLMESFQPIHNHINIIKFF